MNRVEFFTCWFLTAVLFMTCLIYAQGGVIRRLAERADGPCTLELSTGRRVVLMPDGVDGMGFPVYKVKEEDALGSVPKTK